MSEVTHPLKHKIVLTKRSSQGETTEEITELTLRRPKAKDLRIMDKPMGEVAKTIELIAALSGHPTKVIDEVDGEDLEALGKVIEGFTPPGQPTGQS